MTNAAKTQTIRAEELREGQTILIGGFADQPMPIVKCNPAGKTRIHVVISSGLTFSYRRTAKVIVAC